eukprot:scaffold80079_cov36-Tisochrysis_lutea.AAC.3
MRMRFSTLIARQNAGACACGARSVLALHVGCVTACPAGPDAFSSCSRCSTMSNGVRIATLAASMMGPASTIFWSRPPPVELLLSPVLTFLAAW